MPQRLKIDATTMPAPLDSNDSESNASVASMMSPNAAECANADGRSGDTTPGTRNASPIKRKLCKMSRGRKASALGRRRSSGQTYRGSDDSPRDETESDTEEKAELRGHERFHLYLNSTTDISTALLTVHRESAIGFSRESGPRTTRQAGSPRCCGPDSSLWLGNPDRSLSRGSVRSAASRPWLP